MKVAVVVSTYPPYKGGMGNVAKEHADALREAGHNVSVFTPRSLWSPFRYGNAAVLPQLIWKLRSFDVVELHYPFFGGAEYVLLWKKIFGRKKKLMVTYHMDTVGTGVFKLIFRLYRKLFLKRILGSADRIIVTSEDYFSSSQASSFKNDVRVRAVPLSVDTKRFAPGDKRQTKTAIFVGGLDQAHYFKGIDVLLRAFADARKEIPDARLRIVGGGDMLEQYQSKARELQLADSVIFVGRVSDKDLPEMYKQSGFVVLPSLDRSEAFGLVLLEGAATGLPAIASDLPGVRSVIEGGKTGILVAPNNQQALTKEMVKMFQDTGHAARMGHAARERALTLYSKQAVRKTLLEAFDP